MRAKNDWATVVAADSAKRAYLLHFLGVQGSFMPFRLPCPPGSAYIQPGFGDIDA
jgi:hypothetical protein